MNETDPAAEQANAAIDEDFCSSSEELINRYNRSNTVNETDPAAEQANAAIDDDFIPSTADMVSNYNHTNTVTEADPAAEQANTAIDEVISNTKDMVNSYNNTNTMTEADPAAEQANAAMDEVISSAKDMVDDVIAGAFRRLETRMSEREKTCESLKTGLLSKESTFISRDENYEVQDIGWMTIQEFSVEMAEQKIHDFIKTWEYENSWLYCVDFLGEDTYPYDKRNRFRVRWSIPTRRKPVPRATASVYFTFVVSTIKPKNFPVDVFYVFETNRLVHKPGQSRFREKWLKDIIETKVSMMAAVRF